MAMKNRKGGEAIFQKPTNSPGGMVQSLEILGPGIFFVDTAEHGGIMVAKEIASALTPIARKCGFRENGYYCFEEDTQWAVVLRDLLDKGLCRLPRVQDEAAYQRGMDQNIQRYNPDYWEFRQKNIAKEGKQKTRQNKKKER